MAVANALAYNTQVLILALKSFLVLTQRLILKMFMSVI